MFLRNRKDAGMDPEAQESYSTYISASSTRAKPEGKIQQRSGLTTKGIWYGTGNLDNKQPQNGQNIRWRHKRYREKTWKPEKWNWQQEGKPYLQQIWKEVYFQDMYYHGYYLLYRRCHFTTYSEQIAVNDQSPNVARWHQTVCKKWKIICNF